MSVLPPVERVVLRDALPSLAILSACLVAYGLCRMIEGFVRALFGSATGVIGWIPIAGDLVAKPIHKIEQKVTHALGSAERGLDARIGASFHKLAVLARRLPGELAQTAALLFTVAAALPYFLTKRVFHALMRRWLNALWAYAHGLAARIRAVTRLARATWALVRYHVLPRLRALAAIAAAAGAAALPWVFPWSRVMDKALARLWKWLRHRRISLTTGAFLGAFVWALGRLGLGKLRCSRNKRLAKELCTPKGDWLLDLLEGGVLIVGALSIVELAKELQGEMELATKGITGLIRETR